LKPIVIYTQIQTKGERLMADTKHGHYIKRLSFQDYGHGDFRQGTKVNSDYLGLDVCFEFGTFWTAGKKEPFQAEVHDFPEVLVWMGADMADLSELGGEVEMCLGEEKETQMITSSTAVFVPKGLPHLPVHITRMDKRLFLLQISMTKEYKATPVLPDKNPSPFLGWQSKYRNNVHHLAFYRKSAWHYGPDNPDDAGGSISDIISQDISFNMSYESINKAPYRFGPKPDKPHVHPYYDEFALFLGTNPSDLTDLGAEVETGMGKEMEWHAINKPSLIKLPKGFPHGPLHVTKVDRPFIFAIIRPFGTPASP
jgi:uncharacterized RmlC-like cupin family protein